MQTQTRKNLRQEGQAYREFSRQRYQQLRANNIRLSESEVVQQIIRQWQGMKATPMKGNKVLPITGIKGTTTKQKQEKEEKEGIQENQNEEEESVRRKLFSKTKEIIKEEKKVKNNKNEYIKFYKFEYKKLAELHPQWTPKQIAVIIKLEWHKIKTTTNRQKEKGERLFKAKNGIEALRMTRNLSVMQSQKVWKKLPRESKRNWTQRSMKAVKDNNNQNEVVMTLNNGSGSCFEFMNTKL